MAPRYSLARKKARELLRVGKVQEPAVPVEDLAQRAGAEVRYEPFPGDISGMVHRGKDGIAVIGVNSLHPKNRQRFTIAHELGHFLLHKNDEIHLDEKFPIGFRSEVSSQAINEHEIEANQFAAELLMPVSLLSTDLESLEVDIENEDAITNLAERYGVSLQAMTIRLSRLGVVH